MTPDRTRTEFDALAARLPAFDDLTGEQWGRVGAGAALALAGSGLVSLGTLVRLAAVVGGGALVYRTLSSAAPRDAAGVGARTTPTAWAARASLQTADADTNGAAMEGSEPVVSADSGRS